MKENGRQQQKQPSRARRSVRLRGYETDEGDGTAQPDTVRHLERAAGERPTSQAALSSSSSAGISAPQPKLRTNDRLSNSGAVPLPKSAANSNTPTARPGAFASSGSSAPISTDVRSTNAFPQTPTPNDSLQLSSAFATAGNNGGYCPAPTPLSLTSESNTRTEAGLLEQPSSRLSCVSDASGSHYTVPEPIALRYQEGLIGPTALTMRANAATLAANQARSSQRLGSDLHSDVSAMTPIAAEVAPTEAEVEERVAARLMGEFKQRMSAQFHEAVAQQLQHQQTATTQQPVVVSGEVVHGTNVVDSDSNVGSSVDVDKDSFRRLSDPRRRQCLAWLCILFTLAMVVGGIAIGTVLVRKNGGSGHNNSDDNTSSTKIDTQDTSSFPTTSSTSYPITPTMKPSSAIQIRFDSYLQLLLPFLEGEPTFTDRSAFDDIQSPQYRALNWLARTYTDNDLPIISSPTTDTPVTSPDKNARVRFLLERYVAVALYHSTGGPFWVDQYHFLSPDKTVCDWNFGVLGGIFCSSTGIINEVSIFLNDLAGTVPMELYLLTDLRVLNLSGNPDLVDTISTYIGRMSGLEYLDVSEGSFFGTLPTEIGLLTNLGSLFVYENDLFGTIPSEIGNMALLLNIEMDTTLLTGLIPSEMGRLTMLENLFVFKTELSGMVPHQLSNLSNLHRISIRSTNIVGNLDPIFCGRTYPWDAFLADCGGTTVQGDLSMVTCSCCTSCCTSEETCVELTSQPQPCIYGECTWCGNNRYRSDCTSCPIIDIGEFFGSSNADLCLGACAWNVTTETCDRRARFDI